MANLAPKSDYAVFQGKVSSDLAFFCKTIVQVMEPEEEILSKLVTSQGTYSLDKERERTEAHDV